MKTMVYFAEFRDYFHEIRPDNFSYQALRILFDYLEEYEESTGEEIEFDVIAICCDFSEDSFQNIADQYGIELDAEMDEDYAPVEQETNRTEMVGQVHEDDMEVQLEMEDNENSNNSIELKR